MQNHCVIDIEEKLFQENRNASAWKDLGLDRVPG
jgi:hypothetical protein